MADDLDNSTSDEDANAFQLLRMYPDAAAVFRKSIPRLSDSKDTCIVVLDTNVLVTPYSVSSHALTQIEKTLDALVKKDRLVVPAQVAREFSRLRAQKLTDLYHAVQSSRSRSLGIGHYPLLERLSEYEDLQKAQKQLADAFKTYQSCAERILDTMRSWNWDDPVSLIYSRLFGDNVVTDTQLKEDALTRKFAESKQHKIPPGYKDAKKQTNGAGDLIIWQTILEVGAARKLPVLFVSTDGKADWWHRSSNTSLYPRYELVDEFRRFTGGQAFYISTFADFLELFGAEPDVVGEVRREESDVAIDAEKIRMSSLGGYLATTYPDAVFRMVIGQIPGLKWIVETKAGVQIGVASLGWLGSPEVVRERVINVCAQADIARRNGACDQCEVIVAVRPTSQVHADLALEITRRFPRIRINFGGHTDGIFMPEIRMSSADFDGEL